MELTFLMVLVARHRQLEKQEEERRLKKTPRQWWKCPMLQMVKEQGAYYNLMVELAMYDFPKYINFMRMSPDLFKELLELVEPYLKCQRPTNWREPLPAGLKLAITLRFLASGNSYTSMQYLFRVSNNTISKFVPYVCHVIMYVLKSYTKLPTTPEEWQPSNVGM